MFFVFITDSSRFCNFVLKTVSVYFKMNQLMEKKIGLLKEFERVASLDYRGMGDQIPKDRIPIGFFCPYVPQELLDAAGALPLRLMDTPIQMAHVQAHLPSNCCHLVKASLESLLRGELDFLKGIIFSHTCDTMQGLSDIWAFQNRLPLQFNFMVPTHFSSDHARPYLKAEIERLKAFLSHHFMEITTQRLKESILLFNQLREKIRNLYQVRREYPGWLSGYSFASIIRAGHLMEGTQYLSLLTQLFEERPEREDRLQTRVPIFLSGNITHSPSYFSMIEEAGGWVISDDLCSGARFLRLKTREDLDPIDALTERYFSSFLCPTKHGGVEAHLETLLKEVERAEARGVIFLFYKYCEPHYFDYPDLKNALEAKGIPSLLLEVDDPTTSQAQLKIRIQAFVEMLSPL